jgi:hypothetical protein
MSAFGMRNGFKLAHGAPLQSASSLYSTDACFPEGKHDDQVDALGLVGQLMDRYVPGIVKKKPDNEKSLGYVSGEEIGDRIPSFLTL